MAIKKSELYSSLWASCDELRGGMDASQYKDYVLFMLFIKYISDKYGNSDDFAPPVVIPKGASFKDMVALKGKADIGDKINTQVIQPLIDANSSMRNGIKLVSSPAKGPDGPETVRGPGLEDEEAHQNSPQKVEEDREGCAAIVAEVVAGKEQDQLNDQHPYRNPDAGVQADERTS